ncbi:MAG TPA: glycosyltransferase [Chloroflexota bacterium]
MRIVHVYKNYAPTPGGIETHVRQLATGLARRGDQVTVLVSSPTWRTTEEQRDGVRVIRAGRWGELASTPISSRLIRELARLEADVIHVQVPYPVGELAYLLAGRGRPLVVTYQSDVVRQRWARPVHEPLLRQLLGRATGIIVTSPAYRQSSTVLRAFADRCVVVPLAVDPSHFRPDLPAAAAIRAKWTSPEYPSLILFVGRFRAYKGLPYLMRAMAGVPARLLLVGGGRLEGDVRALIAELGLERQVAILGDVSDAALPAYHAAADVFVLPSIQRSEAFGIVLLEAMAAARPVISTELGTGTSWVNQHEQTGLVVPPADASALHQALQRLLNDPALARQLGEAARRRVVAEFSEEIMLDRVSAIYREAVGLKTG